VKIYTDQEAREQGVLTKRDLTDIVKVLRLAAAQATFKRQCRLDTLADKLEVNLKRAFGGK
jgi:hypothetical protein